MPALPACTAGIDSHKDTLTACVVDQTGQQIDIRTFVNTEPGPATHRPPAGSLATGPPGSGSKEPEATEEPWPLLWSTAEPRWWKS